MAGAEGVRGWRCERVGSTVGFVWGVESKVVTERGGERDLRSESARAAMGVVVGSVAPRCRVSRSGAAEGEEFARVNGGR
jgi:hypothetical protein